MDSSDTSSINNINLNSQFEMLVDYISNLTKKYESAAQKNRKTLELLFPNKPLEICDLALTDHIRQIQRLGLEDVSPECSGVSAISNEILQTMKEQSDLAAIQAANFKKDEKINELKKQKSFLERHLERFKKESELKAFSQGSIPADIVPSLSTSALRRFDVDEFNILRSREELDVKEEKITKIQEEIVFIEKQLEKYDDLPPDMCLAKNMLLEAEKECINLDNEVKTKFQI